MDDEHSKPIIQVAFFLLFNPCKLLFHTIDLNLTRHVISLAAAIVHLLHGNSVLKATQVAIEPGHLCNIVETACLI